MSRGLLTAWLYRLSALALLVLLAQQSVDAALREAPPVVWVFRLLPVLVLLPGLFRDRLRTFIWLCLISLCYFITLVERLFAVGPRPLPVIGLVATVMLFVAAMMYVRYRGRELRSFQPPGA